MKPPIPSLPTAQCFDHRPTVFMHALIERHREQLLSLARRRGVTNVRVFGSMVRGGERADSDVDLLVTLAPGTSALALGGLLLDAQGMEQARRAVCRRGWRPVDDVSADRAAQCKY
jgi:predicted nucleotidyltransferase